MPNPTAGPPTPMVELTAVLWLLTELTAGRLTLGEAEEHAGRAAATARAVLPPPVAVPAQHPGQMALGAGEAGR